MDAATVRVELEEVAKYGSEPRVVGYHKGVLQFDNGTELDLVHSRNKKRDLYISLLFNIIDIDDTKEISKLDVEVWVMFHLPELLRKPPNRDKVEAFSVDHHEFVQCDKVEVLEHVALDLILYDSDILDKQQERFLVNRSTGMVFVEWNFIINLQTRLHLKKFPFDRQIIELCAAMPGWNLVPFTKLPKVLRTSDDRLYLPSSTAEVMEAIENWKLKKVECRMPEDHDERISVIGYIERKAGYYIWNVQLYVFVLVSMYINVYSMTNLSERTNVTLTLMLTLVALKFVLSDSLPKISYVTYLDMYVLSGFAYLGMGSLKNFLVTVVSVDKTHEQYFDYAVIGSWVFLNFLIVLGHSFGCFREKFEYKKREQNLNKNKNTITADPIRN